MLRLYVWRELETLFESTNGVAFALAHNVDEARDLLYASMPDGWADTRHEILATEPAVYDYPVCDWQQGAG